MRSIKKILWPTDASESALRALDAAVVMAESFGAELHVLQVVEHITRPAHMGFTGDPLSAFDFPLYEQQLVESARKKLERTVAAAVTGMPVISPCSTWSKWGCRGRPYGHTATMPGST